MLPWSVMARDFMPKRAAWSTSSSMWQAPSRRLYSVWRWRWANSGFMSFPLDGGRGFTGDVVHHAVDAADLVHDAVAHPGQEVVGQAYPVGRHAVHRLYRPERHRVLVRAVVAHHPDRPHQQEHREGLPDLPVEAGRLHFLDQDRVRLAQQVEPVLRDGPQAAHRETRPGEGLAVDELVVEAQLLADLPDLVLEQLPQRLDQLELERLRQAADVVMALDHRRGAPHRGGLDHVGIERPLGQEVRLPHLIHGRLEDLDELPADDLALALRVGDALEPGQEALPRVDEQHLEAHPLGEALAYLGRLVLAQQAVVDEDTREAIADGLVDEKGGHGGVDTPGKRADHPAAAHRLADVTDRSFNQG